MIRMAIKKMTDWLVANGAIDEEETDLYEYAIYSFVFLVAPFALTLIFGVCMGVTLQALVMVTPFVIIRKYSGGYHAGSLRICVICSCMLLLIFTSVLKYAKSALLIDFVSLISGIIIMFLSPVDSENKKLALSDKNKYKKISMILVVITWLMCILMKLIQLEEYEMALGMGLTLTAVLMIPCLFVDK